MAHSRLIPALVIAAAAASCTEGPVGGQFLNEAGAGTLHDGQFGQATMNNTLVMTGAADYRISLARRFDSEVPSMVTFAFNSTALNEEARATLRAQAHWIKQFPEVRFRVYGHTDLVGSQSYNRRLGLRRAQAVVLYLQSQGVGRERLEAVVSHGETQPLIVTEGRERRNRRTVTEVSGFVRNHPMVLNGKYAEVIFREYVSSAIPASTVAGGVIDGGGDGGSGGGE